jgi:hypothetical protein
MRNFSQEQKSFIEAKALLSTTKEFMKKEIDTMTKELGINPWSIDGREIEKYVDIEMEVEKKYNYEEIKKAYNQAFWNLLYWAISEMKKQYPIKAKELEPLIDPDNKLFVVARQEKIADTLLSLLV